jgi:exopolyphosphatase/guanosine-5'-triphosphate,3'-diphosphate pyrophosphatase
VIRNAEYLTGFTDDEIEVIAQVARYHRRAVPSVDRHPPFAALDEDDRHRVRALAGVLRIAIGLDRGHAGVVQRVAVGRRDGQVQIAVGGKEADDDLALEVWSGGQRVGLLADVIGRPVIVESLDTD